MQRNVLPQHKIACFFVSMPNGLTTIQLYAKLSVHINQASVCLTLDLVDYYKYQLK
jgi:hypothetical protein